MDGFEAGDGNFQVIRQGNLEARLADAPQDLDAVQALRYRVFYDEMAARASVETADRQRDFDAFDEICDHLMVIDRDRADVPGGVVGTYRLLRRSVAERHRGFYSADEYDLAPLAKYPGEIMELGRSCVDLPSRTRPTMQLLWRAIAAYVFNYSIELMFGCASLHGTDPDQMALPLSYLYHYHLAPPALRLSALPARHVEMNRLPAEVITPRDALSALPPLIKGYLRLGGFVGDGAVVDHQFNTTDVSIVVKTDLVTEKYFKHYERTVRVPALD